MNTPRAWAVECPRCGAKPGGSCTQPNGTPRASHRERIGKYLKMEETLAEEGSNYSDGNTPQTVNTR